MVPLPIALYSKIASPLQLLASRVASTVMNATGVPVLCEGNRMTLPGGLQMFVAEACSGMRQLTGFLALTTAVAYLTTRPVWYRVVIVISALPIALSANIARVMLTGYIMHFVNPQFALGTYHTLEGLLMMGFGLAAAPVRVLGPGSDSARSVARAAEAARNRRARGAAVRGRVVLTQVAVELVERRMNRVDSEEVLMSRFKRALLCGAILSTGLAAQAGLERLNQTDRPALRHAAGFDSAGAGRLGGQGRAGRSPTSSSGRRRPSTSTGPMRAASKPGFELRLWINYSRSWEQPAAHSGNLPSVRRLDQDRVADSRARGASAGDGPVDRGHAAGLRPR